MSEGIKKEVVNKMVKNNKDLIDKKFIDDPITHEEAIQMMVESGVSDRQVDYGSKTSHLILVSPSYKLYNLY